MAILETWIRLISGAVGVLMNVLKILPAPKDAPDVTISGMAEVNVRGDSFVVFRIDNQSGHDLISRKIIARKPRSKVRQGFARPADTIQEYFAWMQETGQETRGRDDRGVFVAPAGQRTCNYVVLRGAHPEVLLEFTFDVADTNDRLRKSMRAVNGDVQVLGRMMVPAEGSDRP
ncbi:hypothetical protein [Pseudooceanicola marinus]|uniref:hypothetical protein n=1 Tax=Pseudooceanicola marinus TaxID=396013 RepID=UPI001CD53E59|nr:hypothetical protein [Pseudooceanicola marinus]MCA1337382.1 hypothetical protein [Pseudooceanicola marinus]